MASGQRGQRSPSTSPRVKVIDMAKATPEDRFAIPKGSLHYSKAGTQILGMLDKPSLRVIRWNFEAAKQEENARVDARMHSAPTGRRHDAFYLYLANVRAEERANGHSAAWERAAERCRRTHRPAHLATSADNFLEWKCDAARPSTPPPPAGIPGTSPTPGSPQARPQTAPAAGSMSPTSWNMWNQPVQVATSPRFQARAAFEHKRCTTPDMDDVKKQTYAKLAAQRASERAAKQEREALLAAQWPHGMPSGAQRQAAAGGLHPMGLNYGFPMSLPERQYRALYKTGAKWY